jgi:hypothetical protein
MQRMVALVSFFTFSSVSGGTIPMGQDEAAFLDAVLEFIVGVHNARV